MAKSVSNKISIGTLGKSTIYQNLRYHENDEEMLDALNWCFNSANSAFGDLFSYMIPWKYDGD